MRAVLQKLRACARRASGFAFGLWLAGAGCAFCCEGTAAATPPRQASARQTPPVHHAPAAASSGEACPLHAGRQAGSRDAPRADKDLAAPRPASYRRAACCAKGWQPSDAARKPRLTPERAAALPPGEFPDAQPPAVGVPAPDARGRLPDRRGTYVRLCSFLI